MDGEVADFEDLVLVAGVPLLGRSGIGSLNLLSAAALALGCLAIAWLALAAPRCPGYPSSASWSWPCS